MEAPQPPFSVLTDTVAATPLVYPPPPVEWTQHGGNIVININRPSDDVATGRGIVIGMLSALGSAIFIILIFCLVYCLRFTQGGRILLERVGRPGAYDDEQARLREEAEALETMSDLERAEYLRARAFIEANPPETMQTDISLSQFLAIQEKGVSAWEFEPELEIANCFVEGRTEIEFFDSECTVQSNLPIPKQNEVYYWEAKIYDKPESTQLNIGVTTKPYPLFRLPGLHRTSIAYSSTGQRHYNQPFTGTNYGPEFVQGDVVGVGYRPRTGTIFFTRNGRKLEDVTHGLKTQNFFPSVGANGPCHVHVNFGQSGFVFIEANVKKWGLAPMTGSLAPPPPYGSEQGSILLEAGGRDGPPTSHSYPARQGHGRQNSRFRPVASGPTSPGPIRSPTDISLAQLVHVPSEEDIGEGTSRSAEDTGLDDGMQGLGFHYTRPEPATHFTRPQPLSISPSYSPPPHQSAEQQPSYTQAPPPEYSSPASTPGSVSDESRTPDSQRPPVPSYDAAMAETREQISEAVSESGHDDYAAVEEEAPPHQHQRHRDVSRDRERAPLLTREHQASDGDGV